MPSPSSPTITEKQSNFLTALKEVGTMRKAAAAAHVGRSTVDSWRKENLNGFRALFDEALDDFADKLESKMFDLLDEMRVGHNPTLLIFALKALRPLKYRELTQIPDSHAAELMRKLEALEARIVVEKAAERELTALEQIDELLKKGTP